MEKKFNKTLLEFQRAIHLDKDLIYKGYADAQQCFVRDTICEYLLNTTAFVVSTHISKSCLLPVYGFYMNNGMEVYMRDNFHGWVISIKSPFEFSIPEDLGYGEGADDMGNINPNCCEGFKDKWVYPFGNKNVKETTFRCRSDYNLYTLFYALNKLGFETLEIDKSLKDMPDSKFERFIREFWDRHKTSDIWLVFPKTYHLIEDKDEQFFNTIDKFIEYVFKYPDVKQSFIQEYSKFKRGEEMDCNRIDWMSKYLDK